jgi:hypothetical protein
MVLGGFSFDWTLGVRVRWQTMGFTFHILPYASLPKLKGVICVKNGSNDTQQLPNFNMKNLIFDKIHFM